MENLLPPHNSQSYIMVITIIYSWKSANFRKKKHIKANLRMSKKNIDFFVFKLSEVKYE